MKRKLLIILAMAIVSIAMATGVSATGDFIIQNKTGTEMVIYGLVADQSSINLNITEGWIAEAGVQLTNKYIELGDSFGGDVSGTYDAIQVVSTQGLDYHNVTTGIPVGSSPSNDGRR